MIYTIRNDVLTAQFDHRGAELKALFDHGGIEYLCPPERRNWDRSSPVLFPNTGAIKDGYMLIDGVAYPYIQHGFAKDAEFDVWEQSEDRITFVLRWSSETLRLCPYLFVLKINYMLVGKSLCVTANVENEGEDTMMFSIGFHPGFSCPLLPNENAEDYSFFFPTPMTADRVLLDQALVSGIATTYWDKLSSIPVRQGMFDDGSYTMINPSCRTIRMESLHSGRYIELELGDFPNMVLWAPKYEPITNICIEPWFGLPDKLDGDHRQETKDCTIQLAPKENIDLTFKVSVGNDAQQG